MKKENLKKNFAYNLCYQIMAIILPFITAPYISRALGAKNVGIYSYTQAFANYFYLFGMLGVMNYGNRTIASVRDDKKKLSQTFWEIFCFQCIVAVISATIYILYVLFCVKNNKLIYYMQFLYVFSAAFGIDWFCFGMEKFKITATRSMVVRIVMTVAVFVFVRGRADLWKYTLILSLCSFISVITVWPYLFKTISFEKISFYGVVKHIRPNLILFWPVVAVSFYNIMDKLMLGYLGKKDEEVGMYTYAERITQIPNTLILALDNVMMPRMANLYAQGDGDNAYRLMKKVMIFAMMMSAAMAFGLAGIGERFAVMFYGKEFVRCGLFVVWLCPIIIFKGWAGALRTQYIIPKKRDKIYIISLTTGAVINLIINLVLIPRFNGGGAIVGTIAAEFCVAFIQFSMVKNEIKVGEIILDGCMFCVGGLIMYSIISLISFGYNDILVIGAQIIVGIVVYAICVIFYFLKIKRDISFLNEFSKTFLHIKGKKE